MPPKCVCALACSSSADGKAKSVAVAERAAFLLTVDVSLCLAEVEVSCIAFILIIALKSLTCCLPYLSDVVRNHGVCHACHVCTLACHA